MAAGRLMEALNNNGVKAKMLVRDKETDRLTVAAVPGQKGMQLRFLWERYEDRFGGCEAVHGDLSGRRAFHAAELRRGI